MLLLALMALANAQAPALDPSPARAGVQCAAAEGVAANARLSAISRTSRISYYLMQSALADSGGEKFLDRVASLVKDMQAPGTARPTPAQARLLLPQCERTFPKARATAPVKLPSDDFARDTMCMGALGVLVGAAQEMQENGDAGAAERIQPLYAAYGARLTDSVLAKHGIHEERQFKDMLGATLLSSLAIGNLEQIEHACAAALPPAKQ